MRHISFNTVQGQTCRPSCIVRTALPEHVVGRPARRSFPRRGQLHTVQVAALEEPSVDTPVATTSEIPAESGESDEKKYGMDDTSSEVLYQRFKDLIDRGKFAFKAGDIVKGRVERYVQHLCEGRELLEH